MRKVPSKSAGDCSRPDRRACEGEADKGLSKNGVLIRGPKGSRATILWGATGVRMMSTRERRDTPHIAVMDCRDRWVGLAKEHEGGS